MKKFTPLILCILLTTFFGISSVNAATITVTTAIDGDPGSLRDAVSTAVAGDVIVFDVSLNGNVQVLTMGEILIDKSLTIMGSGSALTLISGNSSSRIFNITGTPVTISQVTLQNGTTMDNGGAILISGASVEVRNSIIKDNVASGAMGTQGGGGIFNDGGRLYIVGSTINNNTADGASGSGGGIFNGPSGYLSIKNSTVSENTSLRAGGGIEDNSGAGTILTLNNVKLDNNKTASNPGNGGGLHITGDGNAAILGGTVNGNTAAAEGGGLWNGSGNMLVRNVTIDGNTASGAGSDQGGGGLFNNGGILFVGSSTITNNKADGASGSGGGILNDAGGTLEVRNSTVSSNMSMRAGGGIEDNSGAGTMLTLNNVKLNSNSTSMAPGNGGGLHITGSGNSIISSGSVNGNTAALEGGGLWNGSGTMTIDKVVINGNTASGDGADEGGGGIFNAGGKISVDNSIISNNKADGTSGSGGGILNDAGGSLNVQRTSIAGNSATRAGGGIEDNSGAGSPVSLTTVNLNNNSTGANPGNGGGLHITGDGNSTISGGTVNGNTAAAEGGGLWNGSGKMVVRNVAIDGNTASGAGSDQGGGGLFNNGGTLVVGSSTMTNNKADGASGSGGGILNDAGGTLEVRNSTISSNTSMRAGGGIEDNSGVSTMLTLYNVKLNNNSTSMAPGNGGGLHITGPGNSSITLGSVNGNTAALEGGGLWNGSGFMTINKVTIDGNTASGDGADEGGGGIFNAGGKISIDNSTISNNKADGTSGSGGGILNDARGSLDIIRSSITNNSATRAGGGIEDNSGAGSPVSLITVNLDNNSTGANPGNGGGLHITGDGDATILWGTVNGNTAAAEGGGLWNGSGNMLVRNVTIDGNTASGINSDQGGGGLFNNGGNLFVGMSTVINNKADGTAGSGGGIFNEVGGTLEVRNSRISMNTSMRAGGGIEDNSGAGTTVTLYNVRLNGNTTSMAPGNGGGFHITGAGDATITLGTVNGNTAAAEGGGLWNGSGTMTVDRVTIDDNTASGALVDEGGGGIFNNGGLLEVMSSTVSNNTANGAAGAGGGIHNNGGEITLSMSTISGNTSASGLGGGIFNNGTASVETSTVTDNSATSGGGIAQDIAGSMLTLGSSIIAGNSAGVPPVADISIDLGTVVSNDYNIIGIEQSPLITPAANDQTGNIGSPVDPMLDALANNGGPTQTHALLCGSPAIDAGDPAILVADQRGLGVFGGQRDIGAFELQVACPVSPLAGNTDEFENSFNGLNSQVETTGSVAIFPNPAPKSNVRVDIPLQFGEDVSIRILDQSGQVLVEKWGSAGTNQLNLSHLSAGTYLVQVTSETETKTLRLILVN